jgi:hypothetical protein
MIAPTELHRHLVDARLADQRRRAHARLAHRRAPIVAGDPYGADLPLVLRPAQPADAGILAQLAELDGHELRGSGLRILAEARGRVVAAADVATGDVVADPFVPTAAVVALLRLRAAQLRC